MWSFVTKAFSWTVIQFILYFLYLLFGDGAQICAFGNVLSDESDDILHRTLLPGAIRVAEVCFDAQMPHQLYMLSIFTAVIEGHSSSE